MDDWGPEHGALLDDIERLSAETDAASVSNPRYFAEMLVGCWSATSTMERIALEELRGCVTRVVARQRQARQRGAA
jgi:hypothetical protein